MRLDQCLPPSRCSVPVSGRGTVMGTGLCLCLALPPTFWFLTPFPPSSRSLPFQVIYE